MSLRVSVLQQALPLLPQHSFTRQTLSLALSSLRPDLTHPSESLGRDAQFPQAEVVTHYRVENVIDTLFGTGSIAPGKALVEAWQEAGLKDMEEAGPSSKLSDRLGRRLRYSSTVGEHLVEVSSRRLAADRLLHVMSFAGSELIIHFSRRMRFSRLLNQHHLFHYLPYLRPYSMPSPAFVSRLCTLHPDLAQSNVHH